MRFDESYRQKIDQMHLDDAFIAKLADQMTEAATNREHIEVMEMDPGQPGRHRRRWISVAGTVAAAAAIVALTLNMTLPLDSGVTPMAPGSEVGSGSGSDSSQAVTSSILTTRQYPFAGEAFALYQDMGHIVDPAEYARLESRINSWFYYDTDMPAGDPGLHESFLEQVTDPQMQAWLMQMMVGFDQQENEKIQADGKEIAFLGYDYASFEAKLQDAVLGADTQAVLLTPDQDFTELSRNCRKVSYLPDEGDLFCVMHGVAGAGYAYDQIYYDVQEAAYTVTDNEVHWGIIVYEYLLTQDGQVLDASTGTVIGQYASDQQVVNRMDLAEGKYGSYDGGYGFELEQDTARTAYLFELTSPDEQGRSFTLYNKYPLELEQGYAASGLSGEGTRITYTELEDFLYYYAQRAAAMPTREDYAGITKNDRDFLVWALQQVELMQDPAKSSLRSFTLEQLQQYLQLAYNKDITLPKDADYAALAVSAGVEYQDGLFTYTHPVLNVENGGTVLDRNSLQVIELDDGAFLVTADAYLCAMGQCQSMDDEEIAGPFWQENGMYYVQRSQYGCQHTRQYMFRMQAVTDDLEDLKLDFYLEDPVLQDSSISAMQILSKDEMIRYLSTAEDSPFSDDGSAANYPTTAIKVRRQAVSQDGVLQEVDQRLIDARDTVGIEYRTVSRHSVTVNLSPKLKDYYIYRHADGKLAAVTAPMGTGEDSITKVDLPAEAGDYTLIAVDRGDGVSYFCLVRVG